MSDYGESSGFGKKIRIAILIILLFVAGGLLGLKQMGVIAIFRVVSGSMEPALQIGDCIFIDTGAVPDRFDIVTLNDPKSAEALPLVKRIVGVGGDVIEIRGGILKINGEEQYNKYITGNRINWDDIKVKVPPGEFFLLGDNRNDSYDSLNFGTVAGDKITGVLSTIVWPLARWGSVDRFKGEPKEEE